MKWLRRAGEQGAGTAQALLGDLYAAGEAGVGRDSVEADKWYRLATRTDTEELERLAEGMTAAQLAEAKLAADTFLATYRDS